jgi:hypothetical protein
MFFNFAKRHIYSNFSKRTIYLLKCLVSSRYLPHHSCIVVSIALYKVAIAENGCTYADELNINLLMSWFGLVLACWAAISLQFSPQNLLKCCDGGNTA